ncbi:MAG: PDZ domain-containing protein [Acidobacteria bacterium]|nr:PDZ domain-containing protein [Acidobacteriota bacterium]
MKRLLCTILILLSAHAAAAAQTPAKKPDAAAELRRKTFEKVWETVRDKFYDPNFNGVDWGEVRERYAPQVAAVKTDAELYDLLRKMLSELKVSHMGVITPDALRQMTAPPVTTGLGLRNVEGRVVVVRVLPGSPAEREGLRPGFVVEKVGGAAVKDLDDALGKLHGPANTKVVVTILNERDEAKDVALERVALGRGEVERTNFGGMSLYALFESRRLEGGVGYIRFTSFIPALNRKIHEAVASMLDAPGLVIDLRGNGGGDDSVAVDLAGLLFDRPVQLMVTRARKGEDFYYKARPSKRPYLGPVVVLVDGASGSASEQLTAGLQEAGRAYVVGHTTAGDDMDAELEGLPTGAYLIYAAGLPHTPKGLVVEGHGVKPDLEVNLTRAGLLRGQDAQLDAALRYIRTKTSKGND